MNYTLNMEKRLSDLRVLSPGTVVKFRDDTFGVVVQRDLIENEQHSINLSGSKYKDLDYTGTVPYNKNLQQRDLDIIAIGQYDLQKYYEQLVDSCLDEGCGSRYYPDINKFFVPVWQRDLENERFEVKMRDAFEAISRQFHIPVDKIVLAK